MDGVHLYSTTHGEHMRIGQGNGGTPWGPSAPVGGDAKRAQEGAKAPEQGSASVSLSALSGQLHDMETQLAQGSGFDAARVDSIKEAIRAGTFKVNPEKVADKLIDSVRELVGR
jgi:negative regulator of flagellin synthesis FlgM